MWPYPADSLGGYFLGDVADVAAVNDSDLLRLDDTYIYHALVVFIRCILDRPIHLGGGGTTRSRLVATNTVGFVPECFNVPTAKEAEAPGDACTD